MNNWIKTLTDSIDFDQYDEDGDDVSVLSQDSIMDMHTHSSGRDTSLSPSKTFVLITNRNENYC